MTKKKVSFLINENLYHSFKRHCESEDVTIADKFEIIVANALRRDGVNIKEYPTLTSIFTRIGHGQVEFPTREKAVYVQPPKMEQPREVKPTFDRVLSAGAPMQTFEAVANRVTAQVVNPKKIISREPVPTIDQLRVKRGF